MIAVSANVYCLYNSSQFTLCSIWFSDRNECTYTEWNTCQLTQHELCVNQEGSYECQCFSGYKKDITGQTCIGERYRRRLRYRIRHQTKRVALTISLQGQLMRFDCPVKCLRQVRVCWSIESRTQ